MNIPNGGTLFGMNTRNISQCCSFCGWGPDEARGVVEGPGVNICSDCIDLCRAVLNDGKPHPWPQSITDGIGDDIRLTITSEAGVLFDDTLIRLALLGRTSGSGVLPAFLYRDPIDPEDPDAPRPLRRARLAILEHGTRPDDSAPLPLPDRIQP